MPLMYVNPRWLVVLELQRAQRTVREVVPRRTRLRTLLAITLAQAPFILARRCLKVVMIVQAEQEMDLESCSSVKCARRT